MLLPIVLYSMNTIDKEQLVNEILEMNNESREFGLVLTRQEAVQILEARNRSLQQLGRIELGIGVSKSIIHSFCSSSYISPEEYVLTLNELHEIFYYMKNETEDKIGDEYSYLYSQLSNQELALLTGVIFSDEMRMDLLTY